MDTTPWEMMNYHFKLETKYFFFQSSLISRLLSSKLKPIIGQESNSMERLASIQPIIWIFLLKAKFQKPKMFLLVQEVSL